MRVFFLLLTCVFFFSCQNNSDPLGIMPQVITATPTSVTSNSVITGGTVNSAGGAAIVARGVCWATTPNPSLSQTHSNDGTGDGDFSTILTSLTPGTTYYVRAYAINGDGTTYGNEKSFTTPTTPPGGTATVYMSGTRGATGQHKAVLWTDSIAVTLLNGNYETEGYSVFASGADLYVAGLSFNASGTSIATLWKNGVATSLTDGTSQAEARSVFVSGGNVYVAGEKGNVPTVWLNGVPTSLQANSSLICDVNSVFVSGTDVYVTGYEGDNAKLWINGVASTLPSGSRAGAFSVFVSGSDKYVAGYQYTGPISSIAILWKNGVATALSAPSSNGVSYEVHVDGSGVYVAGEVDNVAKLWKNGVLYPLAGANAMTLATSVRTNGSDVYVCGSSMVNGGVPLLWKNGVLQPFKTGSADGVTYSIFVK